MTHQFMASEVVADRTSDAALIGAVTVGSLAALVRLLTDNALTPVVIEGLWAALPVALILLSYVLTAARERQAGIRRQRGALAALTGLAALSVPFFWSAIFTPVYGIALVLLAVRTRYTPTAAFGALTLFASLYVGFLTVPQAVFLFALLVVAGAANTIRMERESRRHAPRPGMDRR
ncbi:apolipoprotein N-acyltransferase [Arthrobacter sp. UYP6]|uniref:hypothetical protein n=1 Tax=Arthrobacter sp. UYP6 TaxID=1756378 RepID=UPI003396C801